MAGIRRMEEAAACGQGEENKALLQYKYDVPQRVRIFQYK